MFIQTKSKRLSQLAIATAIGLLLYGCNAKNQLDEDNPKAKPKTSIEQDIAIWPVLDMAIKKDAELEYRVNKVLFNMTLEQKVAQMIQPEIRDISVEDMRKYGFGSYLNGGGSFPESNKQATAEDWIKLAESMYQASVDDSLDGSIIPTMWGTDAVHGHNNVIGATLFPHNIGLGAANNPDLIERIAAITAKEAIVTGIDWVFAPTVAVVRDDRWGRTYEGYSEDPEIVGKYAASIVTGLQGSADDNILGSERVISTVKHFLGDGGTENGDDQGDNISSEQALFDIHAQGYVQGLAAGSQTVMASFNSWHGEKNHGNKYLLTDVLKNKMGFDGLVVGDWNGHGQVKGCTNESCPQSINAGLDIFMVPTNAWKPLYENTIAQVKSGEIPMTRIDDAVSRILRVKFRAGIFDKPSPENRMYSGKSELIGTASHRQVARQAVRESLVLLKNNQQVLPLNPHQNILVTGDGADNIGKQSGGWTITWQGTGNTNNDFPGASSIYDGIATKLANADGSIQLSSDGSYQQKPDVAIVVFGEEPYAEGNGDIDNLEYQRGLKTDLALLKKLKAEGIKVVSVFISGRPMWVNAELNVSDAFVAAWLPGTEGIGIADVLIAKENGEVDYDFHGKLSYSWPSDEHQSSVNRFDEEYHPLFGYGYGLNYSYNGHISNTLDEGTRDNGKELAALKIFDRAAIKPWQVYLQSGDVSQLVSSSVESLGAISYKTMDRTVQEDARAIEFDGSEKAELRFTANFPQDLHSYAENNTALTFDVFIENKPTSSVSLAMGCDGKCETSVEISEYLSLLPMNSWQKFSIDFSCFNSAEFDIGKLHTPFKLSTKGKLNVRLSSIVLQPNIDDKSTINCQ